MNKKPVIVFSIELAQREFEAKIFVALEALRRGYIVYITDFFGARLLSRKYKSGIVFFHKGAGVRNVGHRRGTNHHYVFLDEEFGPAVPVLNLKSVRTRRKICPDVHKIVFAASDKHSEAIKSWAVGRDLNIRVVGWPKIDMMSGVFSSGSEDSKTGRENLLFASSFGSHVLKMFLEGRSPEQVVEGVGGGERVKAIRISEKLRMLPLFIEALREASHCYNVVLRPHNSERQILWEAILSGTHKNISIIKDEPLSLAIRRSRAVVHPGSTVGVQAVLLNTPSIIIRPEGTVKDTLMFDVSRSVTTIDELFELLSLSNIKDKVYWEGVRKALAVYAPSLKSRSSAALIMDAIDEIGAPPVKEKKLMLKDRLALSVHWFIRRYLDTYPIRRVLGRGQEPRVYEKLQGGLNLARAEEALEGLAFYKVRDTDLAVVEALGHNILELRAGSFSLVSRSSDV